MQHTAGPTVVSNPARLLKRSVAVIGAGAAGLVAARELRAEGHHVTVFEGSNAVGGVWRYNPSVEEADMLSRNPARQRVHGSMYAGLRTNLPREVMSYLSFPFLPECMGRHSHDSRRFPGHDEVQGYLEAFADAFSLRQLVQLNTLVLRCWLTQQQAQPRHVQPRAESDSQPIVSAQVQCAAQGGLQPSIPATAALTTPASSQSQSQSHSTAATANGHTDFTTANGNVQSNTVWHVMVAQAETAAPAEQDASAAAATGKTHSDARECTFDALVVANGHYAEPSLPDVTGMDSFQGFQMHSHNYRTPERFAGQTVLVVGPSNSGEDISREVAMVAQRVLLSGRKWNGGKLTADDMQPYGPHSNIHRYPMVVSLSPEGTALFMDGQRVEGIDSVIYCTGYVYSVPFLDDAGLVSTRHGNIAPLYRHIFPPAAAPTLSFIGLPSKIIPFPQFELQAKLISRVLSGRVVLPSREQMEAEIVADERALKEAGIPPRLAHVQGMDQFAYNAELARMCGPDVPLPPDWRERMYISTGECKLRYPSSYRDDWHTEPEVLASCQADFQRLEQKLVAEGVIPYVKA